MSRRFERVPRRHVRITARDLQAVEAVFAARYLTNRHLGRLLYGRADSSLCRQRLRYLYDLDYLRKRVAGPNDPDIYYLGLKGRRYLAERGLCARETADQVAGVGGEGVATPALMMHHELALADLYISARLQCRQRGWTLAWHNTRMLELERLGIQPDARLTVATSEPNAGPHTAFIEYTAAMPVGGELAGKLERYQAYWERTHQAVPVLWLTTAGRKADALLAAIRRNPYRDYYLVALIDEAEQYLTAPIWRWGDVPESAGNDADSDVVSWIQ